MILCPGRVGSDGYDYYFSRVLFLWIGRAALLFFSFDLEGFWQTNGVDGATISALQCAMQRNAKKRWDGKQWPGASDQGSSRFNICMRYYLKQSFSRLNCMVLLAHCAISLFRLLNVTSSGVLASRPR